MDPNNGVGAAGVGYAYLQERDFEHAPNTFGALPSETSKDPTGSLY